MSELQQIKNKVFQEEKIEDLLELLGCWAIQTEQNGNLYVAGLPDGDNKRSVQIKNNESHTSSIRSKGINGDIFDVVSYILYSAESDVERKASLHKSKYWICSNLNYFEFIDDFYKTTIASSTEAIHNKWLINLKKKRETTKQVLPNQTYPNKVLAEFGLIPYKKWLDEGLDIPTQKLFQVGIDVKSERVTFPVHNVHGELIGVKGRYCGSNKEIEAGYKYLYIYPCNKSIEFFNYHRALPYIVDKKEVIIVEGGKTAMYLHSWGYKNCISVEGDSLSSYQVDILKNLGLNIKFLFVFDKDKNADYVYKEASKLNGRMKYGIYDINNLLENKESPTDKGKAVWDELYKNNIYKIN